MQTSVKNKYHYFGPIPAEDMNFIDIPSGWEKACFYRIEIDSLKEFVTFEDIWSADKYSIKFTAINDLINAVTKVQQEIVCAVIGAPIPNA